MVGGKPIQQKGAGTEEELAEAELGWRGGPGCGDLWARGRCPDGGQGMGPAPSLPYVHSRYLSRWALGVSPLSRKDIEL